MPSARALSEPTAALALDVVQPAAQLTFLAARQHHHPPRVRSRALHQRQRLQHRIVQVRRHVVAFLIADAGAFLVAQLRRQSTDVRADQHRGTGQRHRQRGECRRQLLDTHTACDQRNHAGERQGDTAECAQWRGPTLQHPLQWIAFLDGIRVRGTRATPNRWQPRPPAP